MHNVIHNSYTNTSHTVQKLENTETILSKESIIKRISYEHRDYESVDEKSLS